MTRLEIERLGFEFGESWALALKWDDHPGYRDGIAKLQGEIDPGRPESSRASDVVGVRKAELYLIEVKDFRAIVRAGEAVPNALAYGGRWKSLPLEIALKTRDTLAGLVGVTLRDSPQQLAGVFGPALLSKVNVFALILQDANRPSEPERKRKIREKELNDRLRQKLSWLTRNVFVIDPMRDELVQLPEVSVKDLSRGSFIQSRKRRSQRRSASAPKG